MASRYGIVYFIGQEESGPVKIGFTADRTGQRRLNQLQTGSPEKYVILGSIGAGPSVEKAIHNLMAPHRISGEWFDRNEALALLSHLNDDHDNPPSNFPLALSDAVPDSDENATSDLQKLASTVASHLISDRVQELLWISIEKPLPFKAWLTSQLSRDDPTGDLALEIKHDSNFPSLGSLIDYLQYITQVSSNPSITRAVIDAWIECSLSTKALLYEKGS